jgi:hypothetical protein
MARRIQRISVQGRRFGYKAGITLLAVKEYRTLRHCDAPLISFAVDRPRVINRRTMRKLIMEMITKLEPRILSRQPRSFEGEQ